VAAEKGTAATLALGYGMTAKAVFIGSSRLRRSQLPSRGAVAVKFGAAAMGLKGCASEAGGQAH
jgi:hypothetical protein